MKYHTSSMDFHSTGWKRLHMNSRLEVLLQSIQLGCICGTLGAGVLLYTARFLNTAYDGLPGLFQSFHLDGTGRGQLGRQFCLIGHPMLAWPAPEFFDA